MELKDVKVGDSFRIEKITSDSGKIRLSPEIKGQLPHLLCEGNDLIFFDLKGYGQFKKGKGYLMQLQPSYYKRLQNFIPIIPGAPFIFVTIEFKKEDSLLTILQIYSNQDSHHFRKGLNFEAGGYTRNQIPTWHGDVRMEWWVLKPHFSLSFLNWINENPLEVK